MHQGFGLCFSSKSMFDEFEKICQFSPALLDFYEETFPDLKEIKSFQWQDCYKSPWASSIEDEDFVDNTYHVLSGLINSDPELGNMLRILSLFSPIGVALDEDQKCCLKQFQSKISIVIYNHILGQEIADNSSAFERVTRLVNIFGNLHKCGEIFCDGLIFHKVE